MKRLWTDLRFAVRSLGRSPFFTGICVILLALGIGANTAIFSLVETVLLRELPFAEAERITMVWESREPGDRSYVTPGTFLHWLEHNESFETLAAYSTGSVTLTREGEFPNRIRVAEVWPGFFQTLGLEPVVGRRFSAEESEPGNGRVVILGHELWVNQFGGDAQVLQKHVNLDGERYQVVGVMPPGTDFPEASQLWAPYVMEESQRGNFGSHSVRVIARLDPGVTLGKAQANMDVLAANLAHMQPDAKQGWGVNLVPLYEQLVGDVRPALLVFQGAVLLVLLIACFNVANLHVVRARGRQKEIAVRIALGAGRVGLVRQLVSESTVLAFLGGGVGALLAWAAVRTIVAFKGDEIPRLAEAGINAGVLAFTLGTTVLIGLVLGVVGSHRAARPQVNASDLREGSTKVVGRRGRLTEVLAGVEVSLALVLLIGAGLLLRSFAQLSSVESGIRTDNVLTVRTYLPNTRYTDITQKEAFYTQLIDRVAPMPGVRSVGLTNNLPVSGSAPWKNVLQLADRPEPKNAEEYTSAYIRWTSPGYFETLGISLLRGRLFDHSDTRDRQPVVVVDEAFVGRYFPGDDPIGKRISDLGLGTRYHDERGWEIVGVVSNVREASLNDPTEPHYYVSYLQTPYLPGISLAVAVDSDPLALVSAIRAEIQALDPALAAYRIETMEQLLSKSLAEQRFNMLLLGIFAVMALALAAVGIYGVMAYSVSCRTQEFGVRMALGAARGDVLKMVLRQGLTLVVCGVVFGLVGALSLNHVLSRFLFEVSSTDFTTYAGVVGLLVLVALLAAYVPARRATRVNPNVALRYE